MIKAFVVIFFFFIFAFAINFIYFALYIKQLYDSRVLQFTTNLLHGISFSSLLVCSLKKLRRKNLWLDKYQAIMNWMNCLQIDSIRKTYIELRASVKRKKKDQNKIMFEFLFSFFQCIEMNFRFSQYVYKFFFVFWVMFCVRSCEKLSNSFRNKFECCR